MYVLKLELDDLEIYAGLEGHFEKNRVTGESGYVFGDAPPRYLTKSEAIEHLIQRDGRVQGVTLPAVA